MLVYILLSAIALFGSAYSDAECYKSVFADCFSRHAENPHDLEKPPTLCHDYKKQLDCFTDRAFRCNMRFMREALQVRITYDEICDEDSFNHILFEREKECYKQAIKHIDCNEPIYEIFNRTTPDALVKGNKEACGVLDFYENCVLQRVEELCGVPTLDFFSYLFDAQVKLARGFCRELILPADDNDRRSDSFGLINPFVIITPLFEIE